MFRCMQSIFSAKDNNKDEDNKGNKISDDIKMDFSNVLIVPKSSTLNSRNDVDLEREFVFHHSKRLWKGIPILIANMDTTGTIEMARETQKYHMITCLHKFYKAEDIPDDLDRNYFMISIGTRKDDLLNLDTIMEKVKPYFICLDIANGYSTHIFTIIDELRQKYPEVTLVAGNVVTYEMVEQYYERGVDIVKMGIGSGSVCTTRLQTGIGYPQFSCIYDTRMKIDANKLTGKYILFPMEEFNTQVILARHLVLVRILSCRVGCLLVTKNALEKL